MKKLRFSLLLTSLFSACSQEAKPQVSPRSNALSVPKQSAEVLPKGKVVFSPEGKPPVEVDVEIAANEPTRRQGLMFRNTLAENDGMLFLFPEEDQLSFWMKNTYLPLDMIFVKADKTVLGVVEGATPQSEESRFVEGKSQYVVEVNATFARRHGITTGTKVRFFGAEQLVVE
jgi:uncharacterized membrane protein (UPF0127 family)